MALDKPPEKSNPGQRVLAFLGPEIWTKFRHSTKKVKTTTSITLKSKISSKLCTRFFI